MLDKQQVRLSSAEEYTISVGENVSAEFRRVAAQLNSTKAFLLVDANVAKLQSGFINEMKELHEQTEVFVIPAGEPYKSAEMFHHILDFLLSHRVERNNPVYAIGGGVTGDLAGFTTSCMLRGLPLVHVPTTLLAIVDSAIGGKTGINHSAGKNLIGTFYQPKAVIAPLSTLQTLPDSEFICGFGEILKYGAIADQDILEILNGKELLELRENLNQLRAIVQRCIKVKTDIVMRDTKEAGLRMVLNYGHTFAHAIEKLAGYGALSHGQAVYIGMLAANRLSEKLGGVIRHDLIRQHISGMAVNKEVINFSAGDLTDAMMTDKKRAGNNLRFVVLKQFGRPYVEEVTSLDLVHEAWTETVQEIMDHKSAP
ncbi:MAG: 3-dehydroquinate synthase [Balneolales bacterium]|nr:3-dehydroquinate synthase [Balneolales bacterium]